MQEFFEAVLWAKIWPIADGARRIVVGVILTTEDMHQNDGEDRSQREPDGPVKPGGDDQHRFRQGGSGLCLRFGLRLLRGDRSRGGLGCGRGGPKGQRREHLLDVGKLGVIACAFKFEPVDVAIVDGDEKGIGVRIIVVLIVYVAAREIERVAIAGGGRRKPDG